MKVVLSRFIKALVFGLILAIIIQFSVSLFVSDFRSSARDLSNMPENSIDLLVLGSSYSFCTISPMRLWERAGITSYDLGASSLRMPATEQYLSYALSKQKPKVVMLEISSLRKKNDPPQATAIVQFANFPLSIERIRGAWSSAKSPDRESLMFFPFATLHSQWQTISKASFSGALAQYQRGALRGFGGRPFFKKVKYKDALEFDTDTNKIESRLHYIEQMVQDITDRGAKVVLFCGPNSTYENAALLTLVARFLGDKYSDIEYINFNDAIVDGTLDAEKDFYDSHHLNAVGAMKSSDWFLANKLRKYNLPDQRTNQEYSYWNYDLNSFLKEVPQDYSQIKPRPHE